MRKDVNLGRGGAQRGGLVALLCFATLSFVLFWIAFLACALLCLVRNLGLLFLGFRRLRLRGGRFGGGRLGGGSGLSRLGRVGDLGYVIRCVVRSNWFGLNSVNRCFLAVCLLPRLRRR